MSSALRSRGGRGYPLRPFQADRRIGSQDRRTSAVVSDLTRLSGFSESVRRTAGGDASNSSVHARLRQLEQVRSGTPLASVDGLEFTVGPVGGGHRMPKDCRSATSVFTPRLRSQATLTCEQPDGTARPARDTSERRSSRLPIPKLRASLGSSVPSTCHRGRRRTDRPVCTPAPLASLDEGLRLLRIGRSMPRKGLRPALAAFESARRRCGIELTIVGDGGDRALLDCLAK